MFHTESFFRSGKLSVVMDGQAGSSGKGKVASFLCKHADFEFACNAFSAQAGHWVRDDGVERFYQTLPSCAYQGKAQRLLIGPGAVIEEAAFWRELEQNNLGPDRVVVSPLAAVIQPKDVEYERGVLDFEGRPWFHDGTMRKGSTCHGVGAAAARRVLRKGLTVSDLPKFREFIGDVPGEVMLRLDRGERGILEAAQGFQLSLMHPRFYPHVTSRNVTVSQALSDMMLPPRYLGCVLLNFRTYPIRIASDKFVVDGGRHLTWAEVKELVADPSVDSFREAGIDVVHGNSGGWYADQSETTWDEVTRSSGSPVRIQELTSVTKLPRRVATFSCDNLREAIRFNAVDDVDDGDYDPHRPETLISINFLNYVDHQISGVKGLYGTDNPGVFKVDNWLNTFVRPILDKSGQRLWLLGTGAQTDDFIQMGD